MSPSTTLRIILLNKPRPRIRTYKFEHRKRNYERNSTLCIWIREGIIEIVGKTRQNGSIEIQSIYRGQFLRVIPDRSGIAQTGAYFFEWRVVKPCPPAPRVFPSTTQDLRDPRQSIIL